jgi:hypothetical protein
METSLHEVTTEAMREEMVFVRFPGAHPLCQGTFSAWLCLLRQSLLEI